MNDFLKIGEWIVGKHRERKAVLSFGFGVAGASGAAGFAENRQDVAVEGGLFDDWDVDGCDRWFGGLGEGGETEGKK